MTTLIRSLRSGRPVPSLGLDPVRRRGAVVAVLVAGILAMPGALEPTLAALADAYLAVSVFVAATMLVLLGAERALGTELSVVLGRYRRLQVPIATFLGVLPGCGGAIIAVTQFTRGHLSFGAVVATLIATMGDAMFLLLAGDPRAAVLVSASSAVAAMVSGYVVDAIHGAAFLRPLPPAGRDAPVLPASVRSQPDLGRWERMWLALAAPGLVIGVLGAMQVDVDAVLPGRPGIVLGAVGALLALSMWIARGDASITGRRCESRRGLPAASGTVRKVVDDTNFVTAWVVFAFVGFELAMLATGLDLAETFAALGAFVPLVAVLVGFVPGCGPQIVVTSLYLSGSLPFSAQLGNAIANDGDALFPALAVAPRAALVATLYSAVPAVVVAYAWHALAPS